MHRVNGDARRKDIMAYIAQHFEEEGHSPTVREIATAVGYSPSSVHAVSRHLKRLEAQGLITRKPRSPRSIRRRKNIKRKGKMMQAHATNHDSEKEKYREAFMGALESLIGDGQLPTKYSEEWKAMKDLAHESAHQVSPFIGDCVIEFRQQDACQPPKTLEASVGKATLNALGNSIGSFVRSRKDMPKMNKQNNNDRAPAETEAKRAGLTGMYQVMADLSDLIPPDNIVALLTGWTVDGVSSARKYARDDDYEFEPVIWPGGGRRSAWEVTKRPPEPEPEPPPVPLTPEKRMEKDIAELKELVGALVRQANRAES